MNSGLNKRIVITALWFVCAFICAFKSLLPEQGIKTPAKEFYKATIRLRKTAEAYKSGLTGLDSLQHALIQTRLSYKSIEFILEYYYPSYIEEHINGAPLLHIETYGTRPLVNTPEGLQVLDEMIFSAEAENQKSQIAILSKTLESRTAELIAGFTKKAVDENDLIEAIRLELLRIFTLGLTGFDTPGSANALNEAKSSLRSLCQAIAFFSKRDNTVLDREITGRMEAALVYLDEHPDFDDFDRLIFLKEFINPLYRDFLLLKKDLGIVVSKKEYSGRNVESTNLFALDFLDPYFYTELKKEEDNKALRNLGKMLFFDPSLSQNGRMSCGSCHDPGLAFTDGQTKSMSNIAGNTVQRNAPTLLNAVYADRYFYDMRAFSLEQQAEHVIFNRDEFNTAIEEIVYKLNASKTYRKQFKEAYGTRYIDRERFSKALASYVLSLQSFNSQFDQYVRGEIDSIAPAIIQGFNLFMGKAACGTCHFPPTFSGLVPPKYIKNESEILGVLQGPKAWGRVLDPDMGRIANNIYSEEAWIFERSFKTPGIRNIAETAPYFHNGAYPTLESVVNFYDHGGGGGLGFEVKNQTLPAEHLQLTQDEKLALITFMEALSDNFQK